VWPLIEEIKKEGDVKKFLRIMEGLVINIGSMVFGYSMVYLFYFIFGFPNIRYFYL